MDEFINIRIVENDGSEYVKGERVRRGGGS